MRNYAIKLLNVTIEARLKLKAVLQEHGEPVYETSIAFAHEYTADTPTHFAYSNSNWCMVYDIKDLEVITIEAFIAKFRKPKRLYYDYVLPIYFMTSEEEAEALEFGLRKKLASSYPMTAISRTGYLTGRKPGSRRWPDIRDNLLGIAPGKTIPEKVKLSYDYSVPIHYATASDEALAVTLGIKSEANITLFPAVGVGASETYVAPATEYYAQGEYSCTWDYVLEGILTKHCPIGSLWLRVGSEEVHRILRYDTRDCTITTSSPKKTDWFGLDFLEDFRPAKAMKYDYVQAIQYDTQEEAEESNRYGIKDVNTFASSYPQFGLSNGATTSNRPSGGITTWKDLRNLLKPQYSYDNEVVPHDFILPLDGVPPVPEAPLWERREGIPDSTKEIKEGSYCLVNGLPFMQKVTKVTAKTVSLEGVKTRVKKVDVIPVFKQYHPTRGQEYILYNVHDNYWEFGIAIDEAEAFCAEQETLHGTQFECGMILVGALKFVDVEEATSHYSDAILDIVTKDTTYERHCIATTYGIPHEDVIAKDVTIHDTLQVTLDHPLNVAAKEWALLYGPSGTGKTEAAIRYANEKGSKYVKLQGTAQVTVDDLLGYKSITTGEYFSSLLRDCVENGYVFILDEIDACNPNTLLALNGLKQEYFQFPDELVKVHKDFRLVATANTLEFNEEYNARSPMDKATLARFNHIEYVLAQFELAIRYGLKYIQQIPNVNRLVAREVARKVIHLKIEEEKI